MAGCASNLPYSIAIGDPKDAKATQGYVRPDYKECVLRLDDIVKAVADNYSSSESANIKSLQVKFEMQLRHGTQTETDPTSDEIGTRFLNNPPPLENCKDDKGNSVKQDHKKGDYPFIEEISKKWLTSYALDSTDPDQSIDRFREYLRSAQLVQDLAKQQLLPEDKEFGWVENKIQPQSQWCGGLTSDIEQTDQSRPPQTPVQTEEELKKAKDCRSLYHVQTEPANLYTSLLDEIVQVETAGTQRNQHYFVLGYEIPWDKDRTLVRYGVTFYFRQTAPKNE